FEVETRLGRRVETTLTHPFLTPSGWKPLADIQPGQYIAVPRQMPVFGDQAMRECEVKLLAYLIGDGGLTAATPIFTNTNPAIQRDFAAAVDAFGGVCVHPVRAARRAPSWAVTADAQSIADARRLFASHLDAAIAGCGRPAGAVAAELGIAPATIS